MSSTPNSAVGMTSSTGEVPLPTGWWPWRVHRDRSEELVEDKRGRRQKGEDKRRQKKTKGVGIRIGGKPGRTSRCSRRPPRCWFVRVHCLCERLPLLSGVVRRRTDDDRRKPTSKDAVVGEVLDWPDDDSLKPSARSLGLFS